MISISYRTYPFITCVILILSSPASAQDKPLLVLHHTVAQGGAILSLTISADNSRLLTTGSFGAKLWDLNTGQELLYIKDFDNHVQSGAFSWDGKYIVTGDWLRHIKIWDSQNGKLIQTFQDPVTTDPTGDFVFGVAFSPDGKWVLSSQRQKTDLWGVATGQMIRRINGLMNLGDRDLFFLPDGAQAVMVSQNAVTVINVNTGVILRSIDFGGAAVSPDHQQVITTQGGLKVWDLNTGKNLFSSGILEIANWPSVFPDAQGYKHAYTKDDGNVHVDQLTLNGTLTKSLIKTFAKEDDKDLYRVLFSHDGKKLIMNNADTVYVYDSSVLTSAAPGEGYK